MLNSFTIDDDLAGQASGAIEVTLCLDDGRRRWCYFMCLDALAACGNWIGDAKIRIHYAAPHMIVVPVELTEDVIEKALRYIDSQGEIEQCSLPLT